jgi:hypothetical protein
MAHLWKEVVRYTAHFSAQEWLLLLLAVIVVGFFCLRGFGSRSNY